MRVIKVRTLPYLADYLSRCEIIVATVVVNMGAKIKDDGVDSCQL